MTEAQPEFEHFKKLGNDAFSAKKYEDAIKSYSQAIELAPQNAVLFSNRCACYTNLKQWEKALNDANTCITLDPSFIKGYYRLSIVQTELGQFDDATTTIEAALEKEPDNDQLIKQLKVIKSRKAAALKAKQPKQLDENQRKEIYELQQQNNTYLRDLRQVQGKLASCQRDIRAGNITKTQIDKLDAEIPLYRSVGKAFLLSSHDDVLNKLGKENELLEKTQKDLLDRKEYLERRINSNKTNINEIAGLV